MYTRCIQWRPDYPKDPKVATPLNLKQYCELKTNIRKVCQEDDKDTPQSLSIVIKNKSQNHCFESNNITSVNTGGVAICGSLG